MEIDEVEFANTQNHPALKVLKYLLMGGEVRLDNKKIRLAERTGGGFSPVLMSTISSGKGDIRPYVLGLDEMSLSMFLKECELLSQDELAILSANIVLNEMRRKI